MVTTVDARNPFRTAWKPWETIVCWYFPGGIESFQGVLRWCGICPSTVSAYQLGGTCFLVGTFRSLASKGKQPMICCPRRTMTHPIGGLGLGYLPIWFQIGYPQTNPNHQVGKVNLSSTNESPHKLAMSDFTASFRVDMGGVIFEGTLCLWV